MEKELRVRFTGDAQDLRRAAQDAERAMREVERTQDQTGLSAADLGKKLGGLAAAYLSLQTAAMAAQKGLQGLASIEQSTLTFEVLFQDADRAKAKMQELAEFAAKTPFELPGIVDAAKKLETFGLNSSKYLKDAGDLAAAFGVQISEVASAFGRINSGDFGEAFERLRDFGIARKDLEGEGLVFDGSGSYQGSVDAALTAIQNIIRRKFGGMMEEQSQTFSGQMANLSDSVQTALNTVMTPSFETLTETVKGLNTALNGAFGDEMQENARVLGDVIGGITTAAVALGKATGDTLREIMAPLRWMKDTATALGKGAGERDVAKSLVLSSGINPNRAQHYANLVGRGENIQNIANDFRVKSWGDPKGVQEDLGKIAVAISRARMIVDGTIQYNNYEPFGPAAPPAGDKSRAPKKPDNTPSKALDGHQLLTALHKQGTLTDPQYLGKLSAELGKVTKNSSDYFAILEKIKAIEERPKPYGSHLVFGPADGADYLKFQDREQQRADDLGVRIDQEVKAFIGQETEARKLLDQWNQDSAKGVEAHKGWLDGLDEKTREKAEASLRSGLEAGVSAFLDGGLQGLGSSIYSLSKQSFSKALVDSVMDNPKFKDALGGFGANLGSAAGVGAFAGIGFAGASWLAEAVSRPGIDAFKQQQERNRIEGEILQREAAQKQLEAAEKQRHAAELAAKNSDKILSGKDRNLDLQTQLDVVTGKISEDQAAIVSAQRQGQGLIDAAVKDAIANGGIQGTDATGWAANLKQNSSQKYVDYLMGLSFNDSKDDQYIQLIANAVRESNLLLQIAQAKGGGSQAIGSMSDPANALTFDAPQVRNVSYVINASVNAGIFMGDKAQARQAALWLGSEIRNVEGQAV